MTPHRWIALMVLVVLVVAAVPVLSEPTIAPLPETVVLEGDPPPADEEEPAPQSPTVVPPPIVDFASRSDSTDVVDTAPPPAGDDRPSPDDAPVDLDDDVSADSLDANDRDDDDSEG